MSALVGTLLSERYRLDQRVGSGGMSSVYKAYDLTLERVVAIKLMHREIVGDSDQLERFRREARAVAQLSHPHIVTVIDSGEDQGRPYIVFEFVAGETLKQKIRRTRGLPVGEAVAYAIEVARALGAAHAGNIVHRDVKPQNVLVDEEGSAKVTDFGIARTLDEEGLTDDGRVLGTTDYVSPEQALGHSVSPQSDLYSLGIVLWEMLAGDVPFRAENQVAVAMRHVRDPLPDVLLHRPEVSAATAAVIDRATAKELSRRYPTADAMAADLEDALAIETARAGEVTGEATTVLRTLPGRTRRRLPLRLRSPRIALALLALAAAVAVVAVVLLGRNAHRGTGPPAASPPARAPVPVQLAEGAAHAYDPPPGDGAEHSPDARYVVDADPNTEWSTESYRDLQLGKPGVGLYLDARPGTTAKFLRVRSRTPGFPATVYGADAGPPRAIAGWTRLGAAGDVGHSTDIPLSGGARHRFFLLWITKLPAEKSSVTVSELTLYR
jgi:tRNA A-37 threonylcarbamoyl transferase component Bud32